MKEGGGVLSTLLRAPAGVVRAWRRRRIRRSLGACGQNVGLNLGTIWNPRNVFIGDNVRLGPDYFIIALDAPVRIGNKIMIGPQVAIVTGNYNTNVAGECMWDVRVKDPDDDQPVVIEDDVWVGMRAIILKGVTLGRGCVVGAGSVVTRDVPPYAVVGGSPARVLRMRFTPEEISAHQEKVY